MNIKPSPSFFFYLILVNLCHRQDVLFMAHVPPTSWAGIVSWFLCNLTPTTLFRLFLLNFYHCSLIRLGLSPAHAPLLTPSLFELNQGLTAPRNNKSATLYVSTIRNWCVLPLFVHWGATLPCFKGLTVPTKLEDSRYNVGLRNCYSKTSVVYLFFIQINKISIFWLTTDNILFFFSSGALILLRWTFNWLVRRTAL